MVTAARARRDPERFAPALERGAVAIDALADVLGRYTRRAEHKRLAPTDNPPAHGVKDGQRRPISAGLSNTRLTGKEGNRIIERLTGEVTDVGDFRNDHDMRVDLWQLIVEVLPEVGARQLIDAGVPRSTAYLALRGRRPREHVDLYLRLADAHAEASLKALDGCCTERPGCGVEQVLRRATPAQRR